MQARAAPLNAQAAPRQLEQPATPTHARAAPGKTLQELSSSVKIKDLRCEKYIRARDMCKTNVMHRQEDCMCKHVCTQPTRRSERMSLKENQGMERKEKKERKRKKTNKRERGRKKKRRPRQHRSSHKRLRTRLSLECLVLMGRPFLQFCMV